MRSRPTRRSERRGSADAGPPPAAHAAEGGFGLVEALIAFVILAVGLLAVAGIALSVAAQTRGAAGTTARSLAAQQVLEVTSAAGFDAVAVGSQDTTVAIGDRSITVNRAVEQPSTGTKRVIVRVPGGPDSSSEAMVTYLRQHQNPPLSP